MLEFVDRRKTQCLKYDALEERFGRKSLLPMWVADMDCRAPKIVQQALQKRLDHGVYGYSSGERLQASKYAILDWLQGQHNVQNLQPQDCLIFAGVLEALAVCLDIFCGKDEAVIMNSPAYNCFYPTIEKSGHKLIENYLTEGDNDHCGINFELLEQQIRNSDVKPGLFLLCSPHNPSGRVWNERELNEVIRICCKYDIYLVSDEIHFDLTYQESEHLCLLRDEFTSQYDKIIFISAPSKVFNTPGLRAAYLLSRNHEVIKQIERFCERFQIGEISLLGHIALEACYTQPEAKLWLQELLQYLQKNRDYLFEFLHREFPELKHQKPQSTYLHWIDCRNFLCGNPAALRKFFMDAGLALGWGDLYHGNGWVRVNFACDHALLDEALEKWKRAYHNLR